MLNEAVNRLRGQVRIRAECPFPERVLNLCAARDLSFWDLQWESPTAFTCRLTRRDWKRLRQAAAELECELRVVRREGAPYALARLRRRPAFLTALVACATALFVGSFFIWDFEITGNETVPAEVILRALEAQGVGLGSFGLSLDGEDIRNHVLLEVPELAWIAVNVSGCRAKVQVVERVTPPALLDERTPANVTARRAGLVLEVRATNGVAAVRPGDSVVAGQLLISGVEDLDTLGARVTAGTGSVTARTWRSLTASVPLTAAQKRYTGRQDTCRSIVFGVRRVKFFINPRIEDLEAGTGYDRITRRQPLSFLGVALPVTLETEQLRWYETAEVSLSPTEAQRRAEAALEHQLRAEVEPYGTVRSTLCTAKRRGEVLEVTLSAECVEEIGVSVPIYMGEN